MYRYASTEYRYPTRTSSSANNRRFDPRLNGARLPPAAAYHQLELDEESRQITTFTTHKGLFQYKRLNFGTNSASEIFNTRFKASSMAFQAAEISATISLFLAKPKTNTTKL